MDNKQWVEIHNMMRYICASTPCACCKVRDLCRVNTTGLSDIFASVKNDREYLKWFAERLSIYGSKPYERYKHLLRTGINFR